MDATFLNKLMMNWRPNVLPKLQLDESTLYISGPMTGQPDNNLALATSATEHLRAKGIKIVSPWEFGQADGEVLEGNGWDATDDEYEGFIDRDLKVIESVDGIIFLPGWPNSGGAGREGRKAIELGLPLYVLIQDPYARPDREWGTIVQITPDFFLQYSRTERLRPHEKEAKSSR